MLLYLCNDRFLHSDSISPIGTIYVLGIKFFRKREKPIIRRLIIFFERVFQFMDNKRFQKKDSGFVCGHCEKTVEPLGFTSRNHCPFCLWSRHLDELPGDRASDSGGLMEPVFADPDPKKGYIIHHRCIKCGAMRRNRAAYGPNVKIQPDDLRKIIALTGRHD